MTPDDERPRALGTVTSNSAELTTSIQQATDGFKSYREVSFSIGVDIGRLSRLDFRPSSVLVVNWKLQGEQAERGARPRSQRESSCLALTWGRAASGTEMAILTSGHSRFPWQWLTTRGRSVGAEGALEMKARQLQQ